MESTKRKRGLFSCDSCKLRKTACHRPHINDLTHACFECTARGVECKTTIKRKKRTISPKLESKKHIKLIAQILHGLGLDINDEPGLLQFYNTIQTKKILDDDDENIDASSFSVVSSGKTGATLDSSISSLGKSLANYDRIIYDNNGTSHYLGSFGFTSSLTILLNNLIRITERKNWGSIDFIKEMTKKGSIISSFSEPVDPEVLQSCVTESFPVSCYFSRTEADFYVENFFTKKARLLIGFSQEAFCEKYDTFWRIHDQELPPSTLNYASYCCIYIVWIIGISFGIYQGASMQTTYEYVGKYINLIKLMLSDIFLVPSADGITCLLLLSKFFERNMQVETAYTLCQTAISHAMSCGFHRQSIANEDTSYLWWSLFDRVVKLDLYLGRTSTVPLKQVSLNYEKQFSNSNSAYSKYELQLTEMNKIGYIYLQNRTNLPLSSKDLTGEHINSALLILDLLEKIHENFPCKDYSKMKSLDIELMTFYLQLSVVSNIPFVLYMIEEPTKEPEFKFVNKCLESSIAAVDLIDICEKNRCVHIEYEQSSVFGHIMLAFVAISLYYTKLFDSSTKDAEIQKQQTLERIKKSSLTLKISNQTLLEESSGTERVRRCWIEALHQDLNALLQEDSYAKEWFDNELPFGDAADFSVLFSDHFNHLQRFIDDKSQNNFDKSLLYSNLMANIEN